MPIPTTRDFGVKFGRGQDLGLEGQRAFPFIYTFVNHNDDPWRPGYSGATNLNCLGPVVPAQSTVTQNVILDQDYNFKLLAIKYSVYGNAYRTNPKHWYENTLTSQGAPLGYSYGLDPDENVFGTSLHRYISITLSVQGSGSATLYGGIDTGALGGQRVPVPLECMQGYDYGFYRVRTPRLLPMQGTMVFEITNTRALTIDQQSNNALVVAALIYGMKVRV